MKKIATIRTKFEFSKNWDQRFNYPHFLVDHKEDWEKVLEDMEDEINDDLQEKYSERQEIRINNIKSDVGCIDISADILSLAGNFIGGLLGSVILSYLNNTFPIRLNKKVRETFTSTHSSQLPDGDIIEVEPFKINPADDNNPNAN